MIKSPYPEEEQAFRLIRERLERIEDALGEACVRCGRRREEITVMAVTKTVAPVYINYAVEQGGLTLLGENKAQELCEKYDSYTLKRDNIHFIGHLQTNKVRQVIDKVSMIQSVDSVHLAQEIEKQAAKADRMLDVLIEVNVGSEESKSGIAPERLDELLEGIAGLPHICVRGLMAIPSKEKTEENFSRMQELFEGLKTSSHDRLSMEVLSLGMSGDYPLAVQYGSTMVRLGSAIFGPRTIVK